MDDKKYTFPMIVLNPLQTCGVPRWFFWTMFSVAVTLEAILLSFGQIFTGAIIGSILLAFFQYVRVKTKQDIFWLRIRILHFKFRGFRRRPKIYIV